MARRRRAVSPSAEWPLLDPGVAQPGSGEGFDRLQSGAQIDRPIESTHPAHSGEPRAGPVEDWRIREVNRRLHFITEAGIQERISSLWPWRRQDSDGKNRRRAGRHHRSDLAIAANCGPILGAWNYSLALEEPHLHAGELHDVVVVQTPGLWSDRDAVDLRVVIFFAAIDVHDEIAFGAPSDGGNLNAWTPERGESLGQFEFAAGKSATQYLKLGLRQRRRVFRNAGAVARGRGRGGAFGGNGFCGLIHCGADAANAVLTL